ncbi:MAG: hypothetical protein IJ870_02375 [Alphaproteobacteria bacterium]|nr:hypothetical protein [Alphaproteobacteria bacterium]
MKTKENGRSMVEMLGVLAIMAVLSVGALAGFNKAMDKYKLNKHAEQISYMMAVALENNDTLKNASFDMISELKALGAFSWDINAQEGHLGLVNNQFVELRDSLQNKMWFENYHQINNGGYAVGIELVLSDKAVQICHNFINVFKQFATELDGVYVTKKKENQSSRNAFAGRVCSSEKCLATITNDDIINMCRAHCADADKCNLYAVWDYPASTVKALFN